MSSIVFHRRIKVIATGLERVSKQNLNFKMNYSLDSLEFREIKSFAKILSTLVAGNETGSI